MQQLIAFASFLELHHLERMRADIKAYQRLFSRKKHMELLLTNNNEYEYRTEKYCSSRVL
jgi:hypothetical protein